MTTDGRRVVVAWSQSHTLGAYRLSGRARGVVRRRTRRVVVGLEQIGRRLFGRRTDRSLVALVSP